MQTLQTSKKVKSLFHKAYLTQYMLNQQLKTMRNFNIEIDETIFNNNKEIREGSPYALMGLIYVTILEILNITYHQAENTYVTSGALNLTMSISDWLMSPPEDKSKLEIIESKILNKLESTVYKEQNNKSLIKPQLYISKVLMTNGTTDILKANTLNELDSLMRSKNYFDSNKVATYSYTLIPTSNKISTSIKY